MRKSTLFISAALTTFMLAVLFGVASAYQNIVKSAQPVAVQTQPSSVEMVNAPIMPTQVTDITVEAAATLATKVLNRNDLFSAEITQLDGVDVYLVTFSSGDLVYVGLDGQILSISKLPVTIISQRRSGGNGGVNNSQSNNISNDGEHEEEHEEEHESDDD
jgi:hypothetical protein